MKCKSFSVLVLLTVMLLLVTMTTAYAYKPTKAEIDKVNQLVAELVTEKTSAYTRAKVMHDWLIYNADYDLTYKEHDPEGVLLHGSGVCQSYAMAYEMLLEAAGVQNRLVIGDTINHAWNIVKLDDEWFHVDTTWDDPTGGGSERDDYFLLSDKDIVDDHIEWVGYDYFKGKGYNVDTPVADSDAYDTVLPGDGSTIDLGSFDNLKKQLAQMVANKDYTYQQAVCHYDGVNVTYDQIKQWAWYGNHPGFKVGTLWHTDEWVRLELEWNGKSDYLYLTNSVAFVDVDDTVALEVEYTSSDNIEWSSDNSAIATVDANGVVRGVAAGTANVTAKIKGKNASDAVLVNVLAPMQADFALAFNRTSSTAGKLTWNAVPGVTEYRVYAVATGENDYTLLNTVTKPNLSLKLDANKQYRYYVYAFRMADGRVIASHKSPVVGDLPELNEREYAAVYDYDYYMATYPDLRQAFGGNRQAALSHFINNGMAEGRTGSASFIVACYRHNYPELEQQYGGDLKRYYLHYMEIGAAEGRVANRNLTDDELASAFTGLNIEDGYYYVNGNKALSFTGMVPYGGGQFLITNGKLNTSANGLTQVNGKFLYLAGGQLQVHHGFAMYDGEWFYLNGGELDLNATGLYQYDGATFLIAVGRLVGEYTGLAEVGGSWYYVVGGQVQTNFTGSYLWNGTYFNIQNGKVI